jgi:GTPase SAR1 family protein
MGQVTIYSDWGFIDNPFSPSPLPPNDRGAALLVGRDKELKMLLRRLRNAPKWVTMEGHNGVGKTSLINVAVHKAYQEHISGESNELIIPCKKTFQLSATRDSQEFISDVYMAIAQTLVEKAKEVRENGVKLPNSEAVNKWLNSPIIETVQAGGGFLGASVNFGKNAQANEADGFGKSGLPEIVNAWLEEIWPEGSSGGVVCLIDNLELLQTSTSAKKLLEELRDLILTKKGVRWVLCGSAGIVRSVASSPRLNGYFHDPLLIEGINPTVADQILASRNNAFAVDPQTSYLPITSHDFAKLYRVLNGNLRDALGKADAYCQHILDIGEIPDTELQKSIMFNFWINQECSNLFNIVQPQIPPRSWKVFDQLVDNEGSSAPSEYEAYGFNSLEAFRPHIKNLEDNQLVTSTRDETDNRRKTIQLTANGWLVAVARGKVEI